jgi:GEVED domain/Secretion system C-terminal sorting domain/Pregnancy-associated plasma protein-A
MSRTLLFCSSFFLIFSSPFSNAQKTPFILQKAIQGVPSFQRGIFCSAPTISKEQDLWNQQLINSLKAKNLKLRTNSSSITYLAMKPHLIRRDDGTGALDLTELNDALAELNRQYLPMNVQFYFCGTAPNYINNTAAYNWTFTSTDRDVMTAANNVNDAHNVYFSGSLGGAGGFSFGMTQGRTNNRTFVVNGQANDDKTLNHEIGHYFNLSHTFRNSASAIISERELVTRLTPETGARTSANCATEGDLICDTPADPYDLAGGSSSTNCVYTGVVTDANGDAFTPSMTNIMNYYFCDPYTFTTGQYARMTAALAVNNTPSADPMNNYTLDCAETAQVAPSSITAVLVATAANLGATITWTHTSSVETGYIIERSTSASSGFIPIGGVAPNVFTFKDVSASLGTIYYYRIKPSNTKDNYSSTTTPITIPTTCGVFYDSPCVGGGIAESIIRNFIIKTSSNSTLLSNTESGCSANSYGDFTSLTASVTAGTSYNFQENTIYNGGYIPQHIGIFIDANHDGDFSDAGEEIYQSTSSAVRSGTLISGSFTIPAGTINGSTRLRIRTRYYSEEVTTACGTFNSGETEDYTLTVTGGVLPLELLDFQVKAQQNSNILTWQTAQEVNVQGFDIEQSMDGKDFKKMGYVKAEGKKYEKNAYTFEDTPPQYGLNYYRLKMMDNDGSFTYSPIRSSVSIKNKTNLFSIVPNPAYGITYINFTAEEDNKITLVLTDITGKIISTTQKSIQTGFNQWEMNLTNQAAGLYFIKIIDKKTIQIQRLINSM